MKIDILCEGRLNKYIENKICESYINRISSLKKSGILKVQIKRISDHKKYKIKNDKNIKNLILDEKGANLSTLDLSRKIANFNTNRVELVNFFLGKPEGLKEDNAQFEAISLSKMTFPHSLARVILCEQIYRCATILANHPYHKY
tara:strand:- start:8746 stop:9180 length:435 start_codon:yes stop_codon:yes gene_type:complete